MIGFVQSLSDNNNNPLTVDSCVDILTLGYTAKVTGCDESKKEIYVLVIPDAKPIAKNGQNINCSAEIQKIIADIRTSFWQQDNWQLQKSWNFQKLRASDFLYFH